MNEGDQTLPQQVRRLEKYVLTLPAAKKLNMLDSEAREAMIALLNATFAARTSIAHYWNADDSEQQQIDLEESILQLEKVREAILAASYYELLDAVDVAQLSALNEHIIEQVK